MIHWSVGVPLRVSVVEVEARGAWVEFECESFVSRYLLPHGVAGWFGGKLCEGQPGSREITQDDSIR